MRTVLLAGATLALLAGSTAANAADVYAPPPGYGAAPPAYYQAVPGFVEAPPPSYAPLPPPAAYPVPPQYGYGAARLRTAARLCGTASTSRRFCRRSGAMAGRFTLRRLCAGPARLSRVLVGGRPALLRGAPRLVACLARRAVLPPEREQS